MISGIDGDTIDVVSMLDFWIGEVDQRIFGPNTAAPPGKMKKTTPHRGPMSIWAVQP